MLTRRGKDFTGFLVLNLVLAVSGYLALGGLRASQVHLPLEGNPSPLGYTRSLALFVIPCLVFGAWLVGMDRDPARRRSFLITVGLLTPLGGLLDIFLGKYFFVFPNTAAVLGSWHPVFRLPAFDWKDGLAGLGGSGWVPGYIPIEEFLFYALGFICILLTYIWCEAVLFADQKSDRNQPVPRIFERAWAAVGTWLGIGLFLFAIGYAISRRLQQEPGSFPGYYLFLLATAVIPSMICFRVAFHFVHGRALTVAWLFVLSISQFWEASLGLPYQWWDYQHARMLGIFIRPHCDLPIEALLVWFLGSWTTVMVHETILAGIRLRLATGKNVFQILLGEAADLEAVKTREHTVRSKV
ncbi:MAG: hypothetical protein IT581_02460 [Verrucomicrobiales bacterium]|nr:hypothetical protein [Verrucomicrobiales bacterium]